MKPLPEWASTYSVDESVGRVMQTLDDLKLAENTVLIITREATSAKASKRLATSPTTLRFAAARAASMKVVRASPSSSAGRASLRPARHATCRPFMSIFSRRCLNSPVRPNRGRCLTARAWDTKNGCHLRKRGATHPEYIQREDVPHS